jgi:hypothetical protein
VEYPPRSSDITPLDFFLWGARQNAAYTSKSCTLQGLWREVEISCAAVPLATLNVINNAFLLVVDIFNILTLNVTVSQFCLSVRMRYEN